MSRTTLAGKRVVITGASSGIGRGLALECARRGARVVLLARRQAELEAVAQTIEAEGGTATAVPVDLSEPLAVAEAVAGIVGGGVPDVVINNAGAGRWLAVDETPPGEALAMIQVPYLAAFELTRALSPAMVARGSGRLVYMTSAAAFMHIPGSAGYSTARWAMRAFAAQVRADMRGTGVGVTLLAPAEVDSPYFDNNPGSRERIPGISRLAGGAKSIEVIASLCIDAVIAGKREAIVPRQAALVLRSTPKPVLQWLVGATGWQRPT